ncbi:protein of unknown function [Pararobbsia alpina]
MTTAQLHRPASCRGRRRIGVDVRPVLCATSAECSAFQKVWCWFFEPPVNSAHSTAEPLFYASPGFPRDARQASGRAALHPASHPFIPVRKVHLCGLLAPMHIRGSDGIVAETVGSCMRLTA